MIELKKVNEEDFDKFISQYPNKLLVDTARIVDPNFIRYIDTSISDKWYESMVGKIVMEWIGPNGEKDTNDSHEFWECYIPISQANERASSTTEQV